MKFIHTADWHIGQEIKQYSRTDEHRYFFSQLTDLVTAEQPDALLVSGDIFHNAAPNNEAVKLYTDTMVQLHEACKTMTIVIIAGNHDSPSRLEANKSIFRYANVHVVGTVNHDDPMQHVVYIPDKGYVIAIPHFYLRSWENEKSIFLKAQEYVRNVNTDNLPVVMMAHTYVHGADVSGHNGMIGGLETEDVSLLGNYYDYLALGHIHHPQTLVDAVKTVRYSGSALHVNAAERFVHEVSLVNIESHGDAPEITSVPVKQLRHFYYVPQSGYLPFEQALEQLRLFNPDEQGYVVLSVTVQRYLPTDARQQVDAVMESKTNLRFLDFNVKYETSESGAQAVFSARQLKQMNPVDVAIEYYRQTRNQPMPEDMVNMLREVEQQINEQQ
ncbi:MAG TPA: hypothetical protein DEO38_02135 [Bacteroidales bacterium]|nr:hypothetical protein [Bacteroidales bacterium]